ncbi:hypothetical protein NQ318_012847 [Aromia moschata]|uniref:Uncharacterized protein n=1 Tax=Aromia moschata TaxID=1265417 RepID=A0AAV8X5C7_9CUCU|nr:hypothetical protein NQ318_012847 [Aromia moschata]
MGIGVKINKSHQDLDRGSTVSSVIQLMFLGKQDHLYNEGRETTEGDPHPSTSKTDENIGKLIREDRRLSIRGLAEISGTDKNCVRQILHESFNMRKVCAKTVPKTLTPEQKGIKNEHLR